MTHVLHRSLRADPELATRGEGIMLTLHNGAKVIDAAGGAAVACLGHGNRRVIAEAIGRAGKATMAYVPHRHLRDNGACRGRWPRNHPRSNEPGGLARACVLLLVRVRGRTRLRSRLARQYFRGDSASRSASAFHRAPAKSYHGTTLGALAAGGNNDAPRAITSRSCRRPTAMVSPCFRVSRVPERRARPTREYLGPAGRRTGCGIPAPRP